MNNFGLDHRVSLDDGSRMLQAREHAAELRVARGTPNRPDLGRGSDADEPCNDRRRHALALAVSRLFANLRRQRITRSDPCGEGAASV